MAQKCGLSGVFPALCLLLLAVYAQGLQMCPSLSCPTPVGFFAHPTNCDSYVKCSHGAVTIKQCPEGLDYNPEMRRCDYPQLAQCNITARLMKSGCSLKPSNKPVLLGSAESSESSGSSGSSGSSVECDCDCCLMPHEVCTKYYECLESGEAVERECSDGLVFNPDIENCDFPSNYQCPPPVCECDCRYPVEGECNAFYDCKDGEPEKKYCPDGLFFNPETNVCGLYCHQTTPRPPTTTTTPQPTTTTTTTTTPQPTTTTTTTTTPEPITTTTTTTPQPTTTTTTTTTPEPTTTTTTTTTPEPTTTTTTTTTPEPTTTTTTTPEPTTTTTPEPTTTTTPEPTTTTTTTTTTPEPTTTTTTTTKAPDTTTGGSVCDIVCSSPQGLFPHPQNCNKWVHCDHNIAHVKDCPPGLHFNPQLKICDWPQSAGCISSPEESCTMPTVIPTTPTTNATEPTIDPLCDCACCHKPAEDCTAYYYCDENHSVSFHKCSEGLVFDPELETCVFAAMYPECVVTEPPVCHCDCFYPAHDCSSYYYCKEDVPVKYDCPAGLYWNQDKKSCDLPEYVTGNCVPPTTTTTKKPTPSTTPVTPSTTTASPFTCVDCSRGQQFFQHPTDCTKYIQCAPFGPQEMSCPEHKVWDQGILTCNYETSTPCVTGNHVDSNGNCVRPTTTTSTTTTTTTTTTPEPTTTTTTTTTPEPTTTTTPEPTTTTTTTTTTTPKPTTTTTPEPTTTTTTTTPEPTTTTTSGCDIACPAAQGLFPHPQKCGKWVHCDHNIPYVKDCPAGLHFNPLLKVCDWPQSAGCTSGPDHICEIPTPAPTTPAPNATQPTPNPMCDCECCHKPADDCTSYYYCDEDKSMSYHKCSEGLVFHPDFDTCVYADMYPECIVTEPPPVCLCDCYYPSEVCSSYYDCVEGVPVKLDCPEGLYWNQDKKSCDLPQFVNCTMPIRH